MTVRPDAGWSALLDAFVAANGNINKATRAALVRALRAGIEPARAREAIRMVHLFGGFPRTLNALEALAEAQRATGVRDTRRPSPDRVRAARGNAAFSKIYSTQTAAVRAWLVKLDPLVASWIAGHAYARVLARPELTLRERELLAVAALAATAQEKQLVSHALGARRAGATPAEIRHALARGLRAADDANKAAARAAVGRALQRATSL